MNFFKSIVYGHQTVLDLAIATAIILIGLIIAKSISLNTKRFLRDKIAIEHLEIIVKVTFYTLVFLVMLIALPFFGLKPSGILVTGGVFGLAIGFASQNIVGNFISGIFLLIERPIKMGNTVSIDGNQGTVEDIHIMSTTLRGFDGLFIRLPNQKVFTANITNYVTNCARRFEYAVGIRYQDNAEKAISIIKDLIETEPLALKNPTPQVFVDNLGDNSVNIVVRIWAPYTEWYDLKMVMLWKIKTALEVSGIQIPFPQRVIWYGKDQ